MRRITVDYSIDDTMARDTITTNGPINTKIHRKGKGAGSGYVKVNGTHILYRHIDRIEIVDITEDTTHAR